MPHATGAGESLRSLQKDLGVVFSEPKNLELALMHSSYAKEQGQPFSNERLEFLGDSVFNLVVATYLYQKFPNADEGKLSKLKSMLVAKKSLLEFAHFLSLEKYILVGHEPEETEEPVPSSRERDNIIADCAEAVVGALYLEGGWEPCWELIVKKWIAKKKRLVIRDYKSRLQEVIQKMYKKTPEYRVNQSWGPEHAKNFEVEARFEGKTLGRGIGKNKKEAEQVAAKEALRNFRSILKKEEE